MNPYLHELLCRLRSRSLVVVVIALGIAVAIGVSNIETNASSVEIYGVGLQYYSGDAYHLDLWTVDVTGHAISEVQISVSVSAATNGTTFPPPPPPPPIFNATVTTDGSGFAAFDIPIDPGQYVATVEASYAPIPRATMAGVLSGSIYLGTMSAGQTTVLGSAVSLVALGDYLDQDQMLVVWAGANGTAPLGDSVDACAAVQTYTQPFAENCTGLANVTAEGPLTGYLTLVPYPALPAPTTGMFQDVVVFVEIVNASGAIQAVTEFGGPTGPSPVGVTSPPYVISGPGPGLLADFASTLGFFVPLAGFALAYWGYARARVSGTVDMVLVRPVTRHGLFLVRYLSAAITLVAGTAVACLLFDLGASSVIRQPIPPGLLLALIGITAAASIAFAGLIFLFAHLARSAAPIIGLGTALLLLFSLFWSVLGLLPVLFGSAAYGSVAANNFNAQAQLFAPPQLPAVVVGILTQQTYSAGGFGRLVYESAGVTPLVVVAVTLAWLVLPFAWTLWWVVRRD